MWKRELSSVYWLATVCLKYETGNKSTMIFYLKFSTSKFTVKSCQIYSSIQFFTNILADFTKSKRNTIFVLFLTSMKCEKGNDQVFIDWQRFAWNMQQTTRALWDSDLPAGCKFNITEGVSRGSGLYSVCAWWQKQLSRLFVISKFFLVKLNYAVYVANSVTLSVQTCQRVLRKLCLIQLF